MENHLNIIQRVGTTMLMHFFFPVLGSSFEEMTVITVIVLLVKESSYVMKDTQKPYKKIL